MKKIFFLIGLILSFGIFSSCDRNDDASLQDMEGQSLTVDDFFSKVSNKQLHLNKGENVIHINYEWNKKEQTIKLISSQEKEPSWAVALGMSGFDKDKDAMEALQNMSEGGKYNVNCSNGDGSWAQVCGGKWSCGRLIAKCLDQGGCATICKMKMQYAPKQKAFYLLPKDENMEFDRIVVSEDLKKQALIFERNNNINQSDNTLPIGECLTAMKAAGLDFTTKEGRDFYLKCRSTKAEN